ncbi:MAG: tRNA (guanosine(37)-N1)-methyltransferase TrmD [Pseudomonadota bacterium]
MNDRPERPSKSHGRLSARASVQPRSLMEDPPAPVRAWQARVITLCPELFPGPLGASLIGRALAQGLWHLETTDLRRFGEGKHRNVDDTPAGGGAGMVLRADVMGQALDHSVPRQAQGAWPILYMSPRGGPFTQARAQALAAGPGATLICGRFEGLDQRVIDHFGIEEVSIGDYVLTGGDIAAHAVLDATLRLLPGVLGNAESIEHESFAGDLLEHPHYTRPAEWEGRPIPAVLTSGDHGAVAAWRQSQAEAITKVRRPDLWEIHQRKKRGD